MDAALRRYLRGEVHKRQKARLVRSLRVVKGMALATGDDLVHQVEHSYSDLTPRLERITPQRRSYLNAHRRNQRKKRREDDEVGLCTTSEGDQYL